MQYTFGMMEDRERRQKDSFLDLCFYEGSRVKPQTLQKIFFPTTRFSGCFLSFPCSNSDAGIRSHGIRLALQPANTLMASSDVQAFIHLRLASIRADP
jgi:hypothetical protein